MQSAPGGAVGSLTEPAQAAGAPNPVPATWVGGKLARCTAPWPPGSGISSGIGSDTVGNAYSPEPPMKDQVPVSLAPSGRVSPGWMTPGLPSGPCLPSGPAAPASPLAPEEPGAPLAPGLPAYFLAIFSTSFFCLPVRPPDAA